MNNEKLPKVRRKMSGIFEQMFIIHKNLDNNVNTP